MPTAVAFQVKLAGTVVELPTTAPSTSRSTEATERSSEAFAVTVTEPNTVLPSVGEVMVAVGATVSGPAEVTSAVVADRLPAVSIARTQ